MRRERDIKINKKAIHIRQNIFNGVNIEADNFNNRVKTIENIPTFF